MILFCFLYLHLMDLQLLVGWKHSVAYDLKLHHSLVIFFSFWFPYLVLWANTNSKGNTLSGPQQHIPVKSGYLHAYSYEKNTKIIQA